MALNAWIFLYVTVDIDLLTAHFFIAIVEISKQAVSFSMINMKCDLGV
jgi:hypothetical protein